MVNLAHGNIGNRRKGFANASDYSETWGDSDSITAVNAQKRFETFTKMVAYPLISTISRFRDQQLTYRSNRN